MSTHLNLKSEENLRLANRIISEKSGHYSTCVHCAYYSCVQLMLHILRSDFNKSDEQIDEESKNGSKKEGGFHNWIINNINQAFFVKDKKYIDSRDFADKINALKWLRIKADYKNMEINEKKAKRAVENAGSINLTLKKYFTT